MKELLTKLQENLSDLNWQPDFLTKVDSDPRWNAVRLIENTKNITIDWEWESTDFSSIGGEPIVIESSYLDNITSDSLISKVVSIVDNKHEILVEDTLIVILAKTA